VEVWGSIISSIPDNTSQVYRTLVALSLTCRFFHEESKRVLLRSIWIEFGRHYSCHSHQHYLTFSNGATAAYRAEYLLANKCLTSSLDRDIIHTVYVCFHFGTDRPQGRTLVKKVVDHLLRYRLTNNRGPSRAYADVNVIFVAGERGADWGILSDLSHGLNGTPGIRIAWHLVHLWIHHHASVQVSYVELDGDDPLFPDRDDPSIYDSTLLPSAPVRTLRITPVEHRDIPAAMAAVKACISSVDITVTCDTTPCDIAFSERAIAALASVTSLAFALIFDGDSVALLDWHSPRDPIVRHLQLLIHILDILPPTHSLEVLHLTIDAALAYAKAGTDALCEDIESVASSLTEVLRRQSFRGLRIKVDVRVRPSNLCAAEATFNEVLRLYVSKRARYGLEHFGWNLDFDDNKIRVHPFQHREEKRKVDRAFEFMRDLLGEFGDRVHWMSTSTEMSDGCAEQVRERTAAEVKELRNLLGN
jgi:hypothetical protein